MTGTTATLWSQHPSLRAQAGRLLAGLLLGLALATLGWWLPPLLVGGPLAAVGEPLRLARPWLPLALLLPAWTWLRAWLRSRLVRYDLTAERLLISSGWLTTRVDNLELYRVRELHLEQTLLGRTWNVGRIILATIDRSEPVVVLAGVRDPRVVFDRLRDQVEACRRRAGVAGMS